MLHAHSFARLFAVVLSSLELTTKRSTPPRCVRGCPCLALQRMCHFHAVLTSVKLVRHLINVAEGTLVAQRVRRHEKSDGYASIHLRCRVSRLIFANPPSATSIFRHPALPPFPACLQSVAHRGSGRRYEARNPVRTQDLRRHQYVGS